MIKLLRGDELKRLDENHLRLSGQASDELMEQAARAFCDWFLTRFSLESRITIFCGAGNNGGDGFAIARILHEAGYTISVFFCFDGDAELSPDARINFARLPAAIMRRRWDEEKEAMDVLIDAYLGVGLKGELRDKARKILEMLNGINAFKVSVDLPSGLPADEIGEQGVFRADQTITFAQPKLSLFLPENAAFIGDLEVLDIGIWPEAADEFESDKYYLEQKDIKFRHLTYHRFSHKGDFGKVCLVGGSPGKMGAILMSGESALRTGTGLLFLQIDPSENLLAQLTLKEAMVLSSEEVDWDSYDAMGIGPGWGTTNRAELLERIFEKYNGKLVLDADALNLMSQHPDLFNKMPNNTVITPHLIEFDRLAGRSANQLERWEKAKALAQEKSCFVVLKGANTLINFPDGRQIFNSTGTKYMGTGGAGDVLTGMIASFLGQGYTPDNACLCAVYHHGLAGELAAASKNRGMIARDIIQEIPRTFVELGIG
ncbi:NAD(P)H-hydrate dehydratase [Algoriphagus namhaensis]